jgi:hypothetical protein
MPLGFQYNAARIATLRDEADELAPPQPVKASPPFRVCAITDFLDQSQPNRPRRSVGAGAFPSRAACGAGREHELVNVRKVVTRFHYGGTHKNQFEGIAPTGRRVNGTGITIQRFQGDRVQETYTNWDALGLMQQLGVVTLPGKSS